MQKCSNIFACLALGHSRNGLEEEEETVSFHDVRNTDLWLGYTRLGAQFLDWAAVDGLVPRTSLVTLLNSEFIGLLLTKT